MWEGPRRGEAREKGRRGKGVEAMAFAPFWPASTPTCCRHLCMAGGQGGWGREAQTEKVGKGEGSHPQPTLPFGALPFNTFLKLLQYSSPKLMAF